jgi:cytochrome c-type biogenesis protein CcmH/NrfF
VTARARRWTTRLVVLAALALAVAGLFTAATAEQATDTAEQAREVAGTLRCPSCAGEDVANSMAPVAVAMREVINDQLQQGRTPEQIRAWFAQNYGDDVLLDPPRRGAGWLLWALPVLGVGAVAAALTRRVLPGRRWLVGGAAIAATVGLVVAWEVVPEPRTSAGTTTQGAASSNVSITLGRAVASAPGDAELRLALARTLEAEGRSAEAAEHYGAASRLRPLDPDIGYLEAAALVRAGALEDAELRLTTVLATSPDHAATMLLLGTLRWKAGDSAGAELLKRFLDNEPDHPAAPEIRQWLASPDEHQQPEPTEPEAP